MTNMNCSLQSELDLQAGNIRLVAYLVWLIRKPQNPPFAHLLVSEDIKGASFQPPKLMFLGLPMDDFD